MTFFEKIIRTILFVGCLTTTPFLHADYEDEFGNIRNDYGEVVIPAHMRGFAPAPVYDSAYDPNLGQIDEIRGRLAYQHDQALGDAFGDQLYHTRRTSPYIHEAFDAPYYPEGPLHGYGLADRSPRFSDYSRPSERYQPILDDPQNPRTFRPAPAPWGRGPSSSSFDRDKSKREYYKRQQKLAEAEATRIEKETRRPRKDLYRSLETAQDDLNAGYQEQIARQREQIEELARRASRSDLSTKEADEAREQLQAHLATIKELQESVDELTRSKEELLKRQARADENPDEDDRDEEIEQLKKAIQAQRKHRKALEKQIKAEKAARKELAKEFGEIKDDVEAFIRQPRTPLLEDKNPDKTGEDTDSVEGSPRVRPQPAPKKDPAEDDTTFAKATRKPLDTPSTTRAGKALINRVVSDTIEDKAQDVLDELTKILNRRPVDQRALDDLLVRKQNPDGSLTPHGLTTGMLHGYVQSFAELEYDYEEKLKQLSKLPKSAERDAQMDDIEEDLSGIKSVKTVLESRRKQEKQDAQTRLVAAKARVAQLQRDSSAPQAADGTDLSKNRLVAVRGDSTRRARDLFKGTKRGSALHIQTYIFETQPDGTRVKKLTGTYTREEAAQDRVDAIESELANLKALKAKSLERAKKGAAKRKTFKTTPIPEPVDTPRMGLGKRPEIAHDPELAATEAAAHAGLSRLAEAKALQPKPAAAKKPVVPRLDLLRVHAPARHQ